MQVGQNLFFPHEALLGRDWEVGETSQTLRAMSAVEDFVIVGSHSGDRRRDYTSPGYVAYAQSLAEEIVPEAERRLRIGGTRRHPDVFGVAVCMSSTFSHRDDLIERVLSERERDVAFDLDSGWPGDNYEVTVAMAMALVARGWRYGLDLMHRCFPRAEHDEAAWRLRLHLPMQFLNGAVAHACRVGMPVLADQPYRPSRVGPTAIGTV